MSRSDGERDIVSDGLEAVTALAREAAPPMTPLQRMRGLDVVMRRREAHQRGRRVALVAGGLSACGLVAAGVIGLFVLRGHHPAGPRTESAEASPIAYHVERGEIGDGGYLRAFAGERAGAADHDRGGGGVSLRFAEGTELRLAAGARGRLTSVDAQGARFAIEQGEAQVNVVPRPGARWLIDAGPFLIAVHGTEFSASWDGATERLDIRMRRGLVSVTGPVADGKIAVRAGQQLTINVQNREVLLRPSDEAAADTETDPGQQGSAEGQQDSDAPAGAPRAPAALTPAPETAPAAVETRRPNLPGARGASARALASDSGHAHAGASAVANLRERSWSAALATGDFQGILDEAQRRGLRRSLAEARSEDLAALGDAARYLRRDDVARQALLAQRERFPRSVRAREAAFLLGRLSETGSDGDVRALTWYDRYLAEAPGGAYASEALGRKMTATEKLRGLAAARDIAREYLRRFPHGTYAGAARVLSDTP
jgi:FecR-like protein